MCRANVFFGVLFLNCNFLFVDFNGDGQRQNKMGSNGLLLILSGSLCEDEVFLFAVGQESGCSPRPWPEILLLANLHRLMGTFPRPILDASHNLSPTLALARSMGPIQLTLNATILSPLIIPMQLDSMGYLDIGLFATLDGGGACF